MCSKWFARRLINGTTSCPRGTERLPPGQKSFCKSTAINTSVLLIAILGMVSFLFREMLVELDGQVDQSLSHLNRICPAHFEFTQWLRQTLQFACSVCSDLVEGRSKTLACSHHLMDQRFSRHSIIRHRQHVACHAPIWPIAPPNLLAARQGRLSGRVLATRGARVFLELVSTVECRRIRRRGQARPNTEAVDWRLGFSHCHELILIEAATREDGHFSEARVIENAPHNFRERNQVAAVEPHATDVNAGSLEPWCKRHDLSGGRLGIVGIDQKDQAFRACVSKSLEGEGLAVVGLDIGMRHRAEQRNIKQLGCEDRRGAGESCNVTCAGGHETGLGTMGPPETEIDEQLVGRGENHACRLGRDQRLEMHDIDESCFNELGLRKWRRYSQDGLVGEEYRPFRHSMDFTRKAKFGKIVERARTESASAFEPV